MSAKELCQITTQLIMNCYSQYYAQKCSEKQWLASTVRLFDHIPKVTTINDKEIIWEVIAKSPLVGEFLLNYEFPR